MGSYVEPGQEHLTTNIFVGNLDPCTTEEELTDVFREFGEIYLFCFEIISFDILVVGFGLMGSIFVKKCLLLLTYCCCDALEVV